MEAGRGRGEGRALILKSKAWEAKLNSRSSSTGDIAQSVLLYFLTYVTDVHAWVKDGRVVGQKVSGASW